MFTNEILAMTNICSLNPYCESKRTLIAYQLWVGVPPYPESRMENLQIQEALKPQLCVLDKVKTKSVFPHPDSTDSRQWGEILSCMEQRSTTSIISKVMILNPISMENLMQKFYVNRRPTQKLCLSLPISLNQYTMFQKGQDGHTTHIPSLPKVINRCDLCL